MKSKLINIHYNFIFLFVLYSCQQGVKTDHYLEVINCKDAHCKSVLYDVQISKHNLKLKVQEKVTSEKETIEYCLTTNHQCGAKIYFSLKELFESDTMKFHLLDQKYHIKDKELFIDYIMDEGVLSNSLANIDSVEVDIFEACFCK